MSDESLGDIRVYGAIYKHAHEGVTSVDMAIRWPNDLAGVERRVAITVSDLKRLAEAAGVKPWTLEGA
jgi:hypothetical protein